MRIFFRQNKGIIFGVLAALSFSLMVLFVKLAKTIPAQETIFFRSLFTLFASYLVIFQSIQGSLSSSSFFNSFKESVSVASKTIFGKKGNLPFLIGRGLAGYIALSAYFFSIRELPIAVASLVQYMSPIFSAIFAFLFLKEDSSFRQWLCLFVGFLGIGLISGVLPKLFFGEEVAFLGTSFSSSSISSFGEDIPMLYWFSCLFSAMVSGIAYVFVRKLTVREETPDVIIFYFPLISLPLASYATFTNWIQPSSLEWFYLFGVCLFSYLGQIFLTHSLKSEKTAAATNTLYLGSVFATIWGVSFLAEIPSWNFYLGALLIIGCQILVRMKRGS